MRSSSSPPTVALLLLVSNSAPLCPLVLFCGRNDVSVGSVNIGAVVSGVLSGVFVLVAASASYYCLKHHRKRVQTHLSPLMPEVTQAQPLYQPHTPAEVAGQSPNNPPHDGLSGANSPVPSQHVLPFFHKSHSVRGGTPGLDQKVFFLTVSLSGPRKLT